MEQFNKALSFILGLVVVAVFIVVASGKFNIKGVPKSNIATNITPTIAPSITPKPTSKPWFSFFSKPTPTPKVQLVAQPSPRPTQTLYIGSTQQQTQTQAQQDPNFRTYSGSNVPTSIPNTGVPIVLFPLFGSSLLTGIYLKKTEERMKKTE